MTSLRKDLLWVAAILAVLVVFFYKYVFLGMVPLNAEWLNCTYYPWKALGASSPPAYFNNDTDPVLYMYPIKYITIQIMKAGELPLWNPYILCGAPLWGNNFACPLNPLNVVFFVMDFVRAWGAFLMLQFAVAGLGMYLFTRERGMARAGAAVAAVAFMLHSTFVIWFQTMSYLGVFCWLPLAFFMIERTFRSQSYVTAFWCGVTFALFVWCGLIQLAAYSAAFACAYLVFRLARAIAGDRRGSARYLGLSAVILSVAVLYMLPELIVQATNLANSTRTPGRYGLSILYPQMLLSYLSPYFYGMQYDGWDLGHGTYIFNRGLIRLAPPYIGILPLVLAIAGFVTRKDNDRFFYLLSSAGILLILGLFALPIVYRPILKLVPFFGSVDHYRLTTIYAFSMCIMAGWGADALLSDDRARRSAGCRTALWVSAGLVAVFLVVHLMSCVTVAHMQALFAGCKQNIPAFLFDRTHTLKSVYAFFDYLHLLRKENGSVLAASVVLVPIALTAATAAAALLLVRSRRRSLAGTVLFIVAAADLLYYGLAFPAYSKASEVFPPTPSADFLTKQPGIFRVLGCSERTVSPKGDAYPPNCGMMYGLQDIRGYENIAQARWYYRYIMGDRPDEIVVERYNDYDSDAVSLMNVKYLMSATPIASSGWKLAYDGEIKIYENGACAPRAYIVDDAGARTGADIVSYRPNEIVVALGGDRGGRLVMSETYYPGWRATVDGRDRAVDRFGAAFRGVRVAAGERTARFFFEPRALKPLLAACAAILGAMCFVTILSGKRISRRQRS